MRLLEAFDLLARNPHIGHTREDFTGPGLLFWPVEKYLIVYRVIANGDIEIVGVTRGGRDIPSYLNKRV